MPKHIVKRPDQLPCSSKRLSKDDVFSVPPKRCKLAQRFAQWRETRQFLKIKEKNLESSSLYYSRTSPSIARVLGETTMTVANVLQRNVSSSKKQASNLAKYLRFMHAIRSERERKINEIGPLTHQRRELGFPSLCISYCVSLPRKRRRVTKILVVEYRYLRVDVSRAQC